MSYVNDLRSKATRLAGKGKHVANALFGRLSAKTAGASSAHVFVRNTAFADMYEIEAGKIALDRASSPRVKEVAKTMIDDHTTSVHQLQSALRMNETPAKASLPETLDERRREMIKGLQEATGGEFDRTYLDQQVTIHRENVDLMTGYEARGDNLPLRSLAAGTAPVMKRHLRHLEALRKELAS